MIKSAKKSFELSRLLEAKDYSDKKHYKAKNSILKDLINTNPENYTVDSELNHKYVGITHKASGFRIHMPKSLVPTSVEKKAVLLEVESDDTIFDLLIKASMYKSL